MASSAFVMPTVVWKTSRFATRWLYLIILRCSSRGAAATNPPPPTENPLSVAVEVLALVRRGLDHAPQLDRAEIAQQEDGADHTPEFAEGEVKPVLAAVRPPPTRTASWRRSPPCAATWPRVAGRTWPW